MPTKAQMMENRLEAKMLGHGHRPQEDVLFETEGEVPSCATGQELMRALIAQVGALANLQAKHILSLKKDDVAIDDGPLAIAGNAWLTVMEARGAKVSADLLAAFKSTIATKTPGHFLATLFDARIACDINHWIRLFVSGDVVLKDIIEFNVLPGDVSKRWLGFVGTDAVWLPRDCDAVSKHFLTTSLVRLQEHFMQVGKLVFRWPMNETVLDFFLENQA